MDIRHYQHVHDKFCEAAPHLASIDHDWRPRGDFGIRVTLNDGSRYDYDIHYPAPRLVKDIVMEDASKIDDDYCRELFAYRLRDAMIRRGHNQATLAEYTGISKATISNYLNCKSSATLPHLRRIAHALDCTVSELTE